MVVCFHLAIMFSFIYDMIIHDYDAYAILIMTHDYHSLFPWWWPMMMAMTVMVMMIMIVCTTFITAMGRPYTDTPPVLHFIASKSNTEIFTADGGRPNKEFRVLTWCHRLICCPVGLRGLCGCWRAAGRCRDEQGGDGDESEERQEELLVSIVFQDT